MQKMANFMLHRRLSDYGSLALATQKDELGVNLLCPGDSFSEQGALTPLQKLRSLRCEKIPVSYSKTFERHWLQKHDTTYRRVTNQHMYRYVHDRMHGEERDSKSDRQTDRQIDRQADRQTDVQGSRQRDLGWDA